MHEGGEEGDEDKLQLEHGDDGGVMAEYSRSRQLGCGCYRKESTFAFVSFLPPPARTRSPALDVFHLRYLLRKGRENRKVSAKMAQRLPLLLPELPFFFFALYPSIRCHPPRPVQVLSFPPFSRVSRVSICVRVHHGPAASNSSDVVFLCFLSAPA